MKNMVKNSNLGNNWKKKFEIITNLFCPYTCDGCKKSLCKNGCKNKTWIMDRSVTLSNWNIYSYIIQDKKVFSEKCDIIINFE